MSKAWPIVRLGEVLTPVRREESVDPSREYRLLGVRLDGNGPFLRETVTGTQTAAARLFRVAEGDFIYSRLFACRGALGVIGKELDGCYVSGEFPTFKAVPDLVDVQFLRYWFRLPAVIARVDADCSGSTPLTRNRFNERFFVALEIPLPSLAEQRRVVARIEELTGHIQEARRLRQQAMEVAQAVMVSARRSVFGELPQASWIPMGRLIAKIENGKSPQCEPRPAASDEWGVLKVGAISFGAFNDKENKALPRGLNFDPSYEIRSGDFLMSRANTTALVGACAIVKLTRPRLLLSDKTFRFHFESVVAVVPRWLDHALKSPALRSQIECEASGTSPTMKNISKEKVLGLLLPPHSMSKQTRVVAELDALQAEVDALGALQAETAGELDALLPAILDRAFKGELV